MAIGTKFSCIGLDVATKTGLAFKLDGVWHTYQGDTDTIRVLLQRHAKHHTHAVIEDGFVGFNNASSLKLATLRGQVEEMCLGHGLEIQFVMPSVWQVAILTISGYTPKRRKDIKHASIFCAKALGADPANHDEADAVCIAEWGNVNLELLARMK